MTVYKRSLFTHTQCGASIIEVLLAMAIIAVAAPFVYNQIAQTNQTVHDIANAKKITAVRDKVLNFVRTNQSKWPDTAQIKLDDIDLSEISFNAHAGFIDKYPVSGATITDVYLAFRPDESLVRTNKIARHIGGDAAIVGEDGIAYGNTWAVAAPEFKSGDLIYRISRDISGEDTSKFLHRATSGEDGFNVMMRDLYMANHHIHNSANIDADTIFANKANAVFVSTDTMNAQTIYFSYGANLNGENVTFSNLKVSDDMYGFKNIYANSLNGAGFTTNGRIITDRAQILNSVKVGNNLYLKSDSARTISGFTGISASTVYTPFILSEEIIFYDNFGLTVSGELLMSTNTPLKIGSWSFPSSAPPQFSEFNLQRAKIPSAPIKNEFENITKSGWQTTYNNIIQ